MTEQIRLRIDSRLADEAHVVCREIGITPTAAVSMFFSQMVRKVAWTEWQSAQLALEEYGVTLAQATSAEDSALAEIASARKAGRLRTFTGKL